MSKKSFVDTPAARMLMGSTGEEQIVKETPVAEPEKVMPKKEEVKAAPAPVEVKEEVKPEPENNSGADEKEPMTKVLIEMSLMDAYKINNIVNSMKLRNKGKYTKKQFYSEMIKAAIEKFEKELQS